MGKSKKNRNKDKRNTAYYDDYNDYSSKKKKHKRNNHYSVDNSKPFKEFDDWDKI